MRAAAPSSPTPARPPWAVGRTLALVDVPAIYRNALRDIAWQEGEELHAETLVPAWAMRVCTLSRRGRSQLLRTWLEWCAAGGADAERRAALIHNLARLMSPVDAVRAINQVVHGGT
jgi:hypothetical protein